MKLCSCGQLLHYSNPAIEAYIAKLVDDFGETIPVETFDGYFHVPRHYIALHGIKGSEVPELAKKYGWAGGHQ